jgi:hypothetical protein
VLFTNPLLDDKDEPRRVGRGIDFSEQPKREFVNFNATTIRGMKVANSFKINPLTLDINKEKVVFPVKKIEENI